MKQQFDFKDLKIKLKYRDCPASGNNSFFNPKVVFKAKGRDTDLIKKIVQDIKKVISDNINE
jgi:hypothetical protein